MDLIRFKCEVITPMFLRGADGETVEFRASSLRGLMRYWWRAIYQGWVNPKSLKQDEAKIFGSTSTRSVVSTRMKVLGKLVEGWEKVVQHKSFEKQAIKEGVTFEVILGTSRPEEVRIDKLRALFYLMAALGGLGNRARRGAGSFRIIEEDGKAVSSAPDLEQILGWISKWSNFYEKRGNKIVLTHQGLSLKYPYIQEILLGKSADNSVSLRQSIDQATHRIKGKYDSTAYEASMGVASRTRFSSPLYTSILSKDTLVITTLNTVPPENIAHKFNPRIQEAYKKELIK